MKLPRFSWRNICRKFVYLELQNSFRSGFVKTIFFLRIRNRHFNTVLTMISTLTCSYKCYLIENVFFAKHFVFDVSVFLLARYYWGMPLFKGLNKAVQKQVAWVMSSCSIILHVFMSGLSGLASIQLTRLW